MEPPQNSGDEPYSKSSSDPSGRDDKFSTASIEINFITLFPEVFQPFLSASLLGRAAEKNLARYRLVQIRDFSTNKHRTVDDTPYGGGPGMVLRADVLKAAWDSLEKTPNSKTILLSPQGKPLTQARAKSLARCCSQLILICGHYEGIDERFIDLCVDEELSIGDYILTGGELPALVLADAIVRLIPGVLGNPESLSEESLEGSLLKYPQYTRPREFEGLRVPDLLLSGDHVEIARWRTAQRLARTRRKRPDLLPDPQKSRK